MRSNHECISHDSRELRADHKVGPYNQRSEQDGVVGRVLSFLKPGSVEFACAPPHFHPDVVAAVPWAQFVHNYEQYPSATKLAIHACVASVIHNLEFVTKNLSKSHAFHGCRFVKIHLKWAKLLQPHVLGGRSGFKSVMEPSGKSLISNIAVDLDLMKKGGYCQGGIDVNEALVSEMVDLKKAVTHLTEVIEKQTDVAYPAMLASATTAPKFCIGYLSEKFPFPVGLTIEDCWRRWHCGEKPLRIINTKMLHPSLSAAEKLRQCCMRRKMKAVMEILQGQTENSTVDMDPDFVWKVCWERAVSRFSIPLPCTWVISTAYDFFLKSSELVKASRAADSVHVPDVAIAAAATAAKAAQDASTFAVAATSHQRVRVREVVVSAVLDADVAISAEATASVVENIRLCTVQLGGADPDQGEAAAEAPQSVALSSLPPDSIPLHAFWPVPLNAWTPGALQCARCCKTCRKGQWQISDKQIAAHFRLFHDGIPQLSRAARAWAVEETAWCVKGFDAQGIALIGHRRDGGAPWMPAQTAKRQRPGPEHDDLQAAQLQAARSYARALTQMTLQNDETQRTTRSQLTAIERLLEHSF